MNILNVSIKSLVIRTISAILLLLCDRQLLLAQGNKLFSELGSSQTGIKFENRLVEDSIWNVFAYTNIYNGGGVAIGDINNDGLQDIYFTANRTDNRLYLNKGELRFEDITEKAGVKGTPGWTTGVTMGDVNGDGLMDIYICQAGHFSNPLALQNLLYINNGDLTFTERAAACGVADPGRSVDAVFLDYDLDNDLDLFVVNHPDDFNAPLDQRVILEKNPNNRETDRLFRNDGNKDGIPVYTEVTGSAGVKNWAFGLSASVFDYDNDGWPDIYVACDYSEPDYFWRNNGDGTFTNMLNQAFMHISNFSMGSDAGDFNNDGLMDLVVVDMMARDNKRKKTNMSGMNPEAFWDNVMLGRNYQYMQNVFQMNNGNGTFSEIAEMLDVSFTDWSWSPLLADLDNDGDKDLVVTNGMARDIRNNDHSKKLVGLPLYELLNEWEKNTASMPVEKVSNYCFSNDGGYAFSDRSKEWGLDHKGFSNGAAFGDLDNDGDLDLVLNNLNENALILRNNSQDTRSLRIKPVGPDGNAFGIGMKVTLVTTNGEQYAELSLSRGFQSSSEPYIHFGLNKDEKVERLEIKWPDGKAETKTVLPEKGWVEVKYADAGIAEVENSAEVPILVETCLMTGINYKHMEQPYDDFKNEVLLPHMYSRNGPMMAGGDVNGDGLEDVFIGGAAGQTGTLFLQQTGGKFAASVSQTWTRHNGMEDMGALFFDCDNDKDLDLYIVSGSNEWTEGDLHYRDRLYLNDGKGNFSDGTERLPDIRNSGGRVVSADFDQDGDLDLFIGGRVVPGKYPYAPKSNLLINEGGHFKEMTDDLAPGLSSVGMVTDARWVDIDQDNDPDLMIVGEWMTPQIWINENGKLVNKTEGSGLENYLGWWYALETSDLDNDGDADFVAGNLGLNTKYKGNAEEPFMVYADDLDKNGHTDIVLGYYEDGIPYPVRGRQCSSQQIPSLKEKFPTYNDFASASLIQIYGEGLENALHYSANWMNTSWIENFGNGKFKVHALPAEAQLSAVNGIVIEDLDKDGYKDILLAGNMLNAEVETCRHDASIGLLLKGSASGFVPISFRQSGFFAPGDVKDMKLVRTGAGEPLILLTRNNATPLAFKLWDE